MNAASVRVQTVNKSADTRNAGLGGPAFIALGSGFYGAGDRIRTDDILLGKQTLCQLSYTRVNVRRLYHSDPSHPALGNAQEDLHQGVISMSILNYLHWPQCEIAR